MKNTYLVVGGSDLERFVNEVDHRLSEGWCLVGGISYSNMIHVEDIGKPEKVDATIHNAQYTQAMSKSFGSLEEKYKSLGVEKK